MMSTNKKEGECMFEAYHDILTPVEVSKVLGVCKKTVYQLLHDGDLNSIRIGRRILVPKIFLQDYIQKYRKKT